MEQSKDNKQGRTVADVMGDFAEGQIEKRKEDLTDYDVHCNFAFGLYRELLANGWPRELARGVLPLSTYSHMFGTVNLLNLFKFMTLRQDHHAQYEIRVYAEAMERLIQPIVPVCVRAWASDFKSLQSIAKG